MFGTSHSSLNSVFHGILFAVTLFIGFEAAASIGEEAREPRKAIPDRADRQSSRSPGCSTCWSRTPRRSGSESRAPLRFGPPTPHRWAHSPSITSATGLSVLIDLVVMLDSISVAMAFIVAGSRVFFALGRDGLLPKFTTRSHVTTRRSAATS